MSLVHKQPWRPDFVRLHPWFWPLARAAERLASFPAWPTRGDFDAIYAELAAARGARPLAFAPNVRKEDKRANGKVVLEALYDARIALFSEVPTRERDWHDCFNALCFATFPHSKLALHARQYVALAARIAAGAGRLPGARTREQDALTLFDEGGVVLAATPEAMAELANAEPASLAVRLAEFEQRGQARVVPFGHALFEHLVEGLVCPGGGTRMLALDPLPAQDGALLDALDRALAGLIADPRAFQSPAEHLQLRFNAIDGPR